MAAIDHHQPPAVEPVGAHTARAGADVGAALGGIDGIENHQPGIVDHAVGIFEGKADRPLQRGADRMVGDIDGGRRRQTGARGKAVVQQQPRPEHPGLPLVGMGGNDKTHRTHQMRRGAQPDIALAERRADAKQRPAFQHLEVAVDQPRPGLRCAGAEIALLQQDHAQAAAGGVARDADAVEAPTDDSQIVVRHARAIAFSSEVDTGSRQENASNNKRELRF